MLRCWIQIAKAQWGYANYLKFLSILATLKRRGKLMESSQWFPFRSFDAQFWMVPLHSFAGLRSGLRLTKASLKRLALSCSDPSFQDFSPVMFQLIPVPKQFLSLRNEAK